MILQQSHSLRFLQRQLFLCDAPDHSVPEKEKRMVTAVQKARQAKGQTPPQLSGNLFLRKRDNEAVILCTAAVREDQETAGIIFLQSVVPQNGSEILSFPRNDPLFHPDLAPVGIHRPFSFFYKGGENERGFPFIHIFTDFDGKAHAVRIIEKPCQVPVFLNGCITYCKSFHNSSTSPRSFAR